MSLLSIFDKPKIPEGLDDAQRKEYCLQQDNPVLWKQYFKAKAKGNYSTTDLEFIFEAEEVFQQALHRHAENTVQFLFPKLKHNAQALLNSCLYSRRDLMRRFDISNVPMHRKRNMLSIALKTNCTDTQNDVVHAIRYNCFTKENIQPKTLSTDELNGINNLNISSKEINNETLLQLFAQRPDLVGDVMTQTPLSELFDDACKTLRGCNETLMQQKNWLKSILEHSITHELIEQHPEDFFQFCCDLLGYETIDPAVSQYGFALIKPLIDQHIDHKYLKEVPETDPSFFGVSTLRTILTSLPSTLAVTLAYRPQNKLGVLVDVLQQYHSFDALMNNILSNDDLDVAPIVEALCEQNMEQAKTYFRGSSLPEGVWYEHTQAAQLNAVLNGVMTEKSGSRKKKM